MSDTPICPNCKIPYAPLSKDDKRRLALAKEYDLVCPQCFGSIGKENSTPEHLFDQMNWERSYFLVLIQSLRSIETVKTLLEKCEVLRTIFAPESNVRYAWANVAPELLRELWAVMDKIGGTVPRRPKSLNGRPSVSEKFIQKVLRAIDEVVRWCESKQSEVDAAPIDGRDSSRLQSSKDLARKLGPSVKLAAVESFLRRYRAKFPDCAMPTDSPRRNEPRFLYRVADVLPALKEHFAKKS
jgi:hypothetical protein